MKPYLHPSTFPPKVPAMGLLRQLKRNIGVLGAARAMIFVVGVLVAGFMAASLGRYDVAAGAFVGISIPRLFADTLVARPNVTGRVLPICAVVIMVTAVTLSMVRENGGLIDEVVTGPAASLFMFIVAAYIGSFVTFLADPRIELRKS